MGPRAQGRRLGPGWTTLTPFPTRPALAVTPAYPFPWPTANPNSGGREGAPGARWRVAPPILSLRAAREASPGVGTRTQSRVCTGAAGQSACRVSRTAAGHGPLPGKLRFLAGPRPWKPLPPEGELQFAPQDGPRGVAAVKLRSGAKSLPPAPHSCCQGCDGAPRLSASGHVGLADRGRFRARHPRASLRAAGTASPHPHPARPRRKRAA